MIESYNIERPAESEILFQKCTNLKINDAKYDNKNRLWNIFVNLEQ